MPRAVAQPSSCGFNPPTLGSINPLQYKDNTMTTESTKERPRAVFSTMDIDMIKQLITDKLNSNTATEDESTKLSALYHRLRRVS
jgi:hypothetical protein